MSIGIAFARLWLKTAIDDFLQLGRNRGSKLAGRFRLLTPPVKGINALKWGSTGHHFVENDPYCINVAAGVRALSAQLLRRDIVRNADRLRQIGECYPARSDRLPPFRN